MVYIAGSDASSADRFERYFTRGFEHAARRFAHAGSSRRTQIEALTIALRKLMRVNRGQEYENYHTIDFVFEGSPCRVLARRYEV